MFFQNDMRPYIALSTFGFYTNGHLDVQLSQLTVDDEQSTDLVRIMELLAFRMVVISIYMLLVIAVWPVVGQDDH